VLGYRRWVLEKGVLKAEDARALFDIALKCSVSFLGSGDFGISLPLWAKWIR
jgi:hypothetical protein